VAAYGELAMPSRWAQDARIPEELKARLEAWRSGNDVITAAELVESAIVEGREKEAERAARSLVRKGSEATPLVKKQAALLLEKLDPVWVVDGTRLQRDHPRFNEGKRDRRLTKIEGILACPGKCFPAMWLDSSVQGIFDFRGVDGGHPSNVFRDVL
jgi:hypothetical protein